MIGISFYLNDPLAEQRLVKAQEKGVKQAFTSLHIPEETGDLAKRAKSLLQLAKQLGIDVYADVSNRTPKHMGIQGFEELKLLGVTGLRLDDFFDYSTMIELSKQFRIALNASIVLERDLMALLAGGVEQEHLIAWHNFYPRRETGLDDSFFQAQCSLFQRYHIPVFAFVPGCGEKRGPLFAGLPTLERHRDLDPFVSAVELYRAGVETVYVGDPEAGEELLERWREYDAKRILPIRIRTTVLSSGEYRLRPDFARDVLRFMDTRSSKSIPPSHTVQRPAGTLTIDNDLYGRYRGEVQITLTYLPADDRVNVIGYVVPEDLSLLTLLQPGQRVYLHC
jgi:hypothetical protein